MSEILDFSTVDANNNGPANQAGWPENMNYALVNDAGRALSGALARWHQDTSGVLNTGGSNGAYTLTPTRTISAYAVGQVFMIKANHSNPSAATIAVSGLSAVALQRPDGTSLDGGDLTANGLYVIAYNGTGFTVMGLDQQRRGSFTPVVDGAVATYSVQSGNYTRRGRQVSFGMDLTFELTSTFSGAISISGLPFAADSTLTTSLMSTQIFSIPGGLVAWPSGVTSIFGFVEEGTSVVGLAGNGDGGINLAFGGGNLSAGGNIVIRVTGSYSTDAP